jgi:hypothetical protein
VILLRLAWPMLAAADAAVHPVFRALNALQVALSFPGALVKARLSADLHHLTRPLGWAWAVVFHVFWSPLRALSGLYFSVWSPLLYEAGTEGTGVMRLWRVLGEGMLGLAMDIVLPTATLFHGTRFRHAVRILERRCWLVGERDFAGRGVYFSPSWRCAAHYAGRGACSHAADTPHDEDGVVVSARVVLLPTRLLGSTGLEEGDGRNITGWYRAHGYRLVRHWRGGDKNWWEFCHIMENHRGRDLLRVRELGVREAGGHLVSGQPRKGWLAPHFAAASLACWAVLGLLAALGSHA